MTCYDIEGNKTNEVMKSSTNKNNSYFLRKSYRTTDDIFKKYDYYANKSSVWRIYVCSYSSSKPIPHEIINKSKNDGSLF